MAVAMAEALAPHQWEAASVPSPAVPSPYLLAPVRPARRRILWARRLRALVLLAGLVLAIRSVPGGPGSAPLSDPAPVRARTITATATAAAAPTAVHIVQPGETLWSIARDLQPRGEIRPLVDRLAALRRGQPLRIGDRIDLTSLSRS